jgi:hypothetical protein
MHECFRSPALLSFKIIEILGGDNERLDQRARPSVGGRTGNEE